MRVYLYRCIEGHQFERLGELDADLVYCECGNPARRRPYSSVPYIKGDTVAKGIPEPEYRIEREVKDLAARNWTVERSVEAIRKNTKLDPQGQRQLDIAAMNREGA